MPELGLRIIVVAVPDTVATVFIVRFEEHARRFRQRLSRLQRDTGRKKGLAYFQAGQYGRQCRPRLWIDPGGFQMSNPLAIGNKIFLGRLPRDYPSDRLFLNRWVAGTKRARHTMDIVAGGPQMKAVVFSDLHVALSFPDPVELPSDTDVLVVAGDVSAPVAKSMAWLHKRFPDVPTVYVAGNHDHYGQIYAQSIESGRRDRELYPSVHFLENNEVVIKGVRFLGTTLWTDFDLYGRPDDHADYAQNGLNDFSQIYDLDPNGQLMRWTPRRTQLLHAESRAWLREAMATEFEGPTVVVTHHAPHPLSVDEKFKGNHLTPAFCSNLSSEIAEFQPEVWVHGHTHANFDYVVPGTRTRVFCNPRGYVKDNFERGRTVENPAFEMIGVVEF